MCIGAYWSSIQARLGTLMPAASKPSGWSSFSAAETLSLRSRVERAKGRKRNPEASCRRSSTLLYSSKRNCAFSQKASKAGSLGRPFKRRRSCPMSAFWDRKANSAAICGPCFSFVRSRGNRHCDENSPVMNWNAATVAEELAMNNGRVQARKASLAARL